MQRMGRRYRPARPPPLPCTAAGHAPATTGQRRRRTPAPPRWRPLGCRRPTTGGGAMDTLDGRTAVITGGASGMGRAFADRFAAAGMRVVVADIEEAPLSAAV